MATLYYHPNGDDSLAGTSAGTARKSLNSLGSGASVANNATTRFAAGDTILLARGGIWVPAVENMNVRFMFDPSVSVHNGQYLGSYDAGIGSNRPILDMLLYDDGTGWSYLSAGRWTKTYAATDGISLLGRCWPALTGPSSPRNYDAMRLMASAADVVAEYQYYITGLTATVYTGSSAVNPFYYYSGIAFARRTYGSSNLIGRLRQLAGESVRDGIVFRGGSIGLQSGALDCRFEQLRFDSMESCAFVISEGGYVSSRLTISEPSFDWYTGEKENEGSSARFGGWNGIQISPTPTSGTNGVFGVDIIDLNCRGARHLALQAINDSATYLNGVSGIVMRATKKGRSVIDSRDIDYGRAFGVTCSGALLKDLIFTGAPTHCQMAGLGRIENCDWINNRPAQSDASNQGTDCCLWTSSPYNSLYSADIVPRTSISVVGCLFDTPVNFAYAHSDGTGLGTTPVGVGDIRLINNTIIDQTYYNQRKTIQYTTQLPMPSASMLIYSASTGTPVFPTLKNNLFVLPNGATTVYLHKDQATGTTPVGAPDTRFKVNPYTVNDATAPVVPVANQQYASRDAAGIGSDNRVSSAASPVVGAGVFAGYSSDPAGIQRWNPPTVGAYEYQRARPSRF